MSKRCAKCEKAVYPLEELKCLDKIWHKACFKCWECGMTLNMKNYKGYDKKPYCTAHYPKTSFTAVADTPEMARLAQNTKLQSQIQYHEEFEKAKGKYTAISDDPEIKRVLENTQKISTLAYHSRFEQQKGKYTAVPDDLETRRHQTNMKNISMVAYHDQFEKSMRGKCTSIADDPETIRALKNQQAVSMVKYHEDFEKNIKGTKTQVSDDPEMRRLKQNTAIQSNVQYQGLKEKAAEMEQRRSNVQQGGVGQPEYHAPLRAPMLAQEQEHRPSPYRDRNQGHSTVYTDQGKSEQVTQQRIGSIHDYDPVNENYGSLGHGYAPRSSTHGQAQWEETVTVPSPGPHSNHASQQHLAYNGALTSPPYYGSPNGSPAIPTANITLTTDLPPQQNPSDSTSPHGSPNVQRANLAGISNQNGVMPKGPLVPLGRPLSLMVHHPAEPQHYPPAHNPPAPQPAAPQLSPQPPMQPPPQEPMAPPMPAEPASPPVQSQGPVYQAMYDYDAQDDDEVGFIDGDMIIDVEPIDEGWMIGTVRRTGQRGMLPANYVEKV